MNRFWASLLIVFAAFLVWDWIRNQKRLNISAIFRKIEIRENGDVWLHESREAFYVGSPSKVVCKIPAKFVTVTIVGGGEKPTARLVADDWMVQRKRNGKGNYYLGG